jgi:hypothetical protein
MIFTEFQAQLRVWANFENMPAVYSKFGGPLGKIYIGPVPNQDYTSYWDVQYVPAALVDDNSTDELAYPYDEPVAYYAAYMAKFKEQNYGESTLFEQQYRQHAAHAITASFTRVLPNPYAYPQGA